MKKQKKLGMSKKDEIKKLDLNLINIIMKAPLL